VLAFQAKALEVLTLEALKQRTAVQAKWVLQAQTLKA
jgi:hypothetical protein